MMRTRTPSRLSQMANTRPVGPAPQMRTCVVGIDTLEFLSSHSGRSYPGAAYMPRCAVMLAPEIVMSRGAEDCRAMHHRPPACRMRCAVDIGIFESGPPNPI